MDIGGHARGAAAAVPPTPACACRCRPGSRPSAAARVGADWRGGFWLPECAHASWLDPLLEEAGVHATCVDLTDVLGLGVRRPLRPLRSPAGPLLVPDRPHRPSSSSGATGGYPAHGALPRLPPPHDPPTTGRGPTTARPTTTTRRWRRRATTPRTSWRARSSGSTPAGRSSGARPCWCARWTPSCSGTGGTKGPQWLRAVLDEAAEQGLALAALDDALARHEPAWAPPDLPATTWGTPRTLSTWSGPRVADLAWAARDAELRVVGAGAAAPTRCPCASCCCAPVQRLGLHGQP